SAAATQHHGEGAGHDPQIFQRGLAADVLEVVTNLAPHVVDRRVVALVDLRPAGDAGANALAPLIPFDLLPQIHEDGRLFGAWTHDVHVTLQHVEEMRQLVEPKLAKHLAERRDARGRALPMGHAATVRFSRGGGVGLPGWCSWPQAFAKSVRARAPARL